MPRLRLAVAGLALTAAACSSTAPDTPGAAPPVAPGPTATQSSHAPLPAQRLSVTSEPSNARVTIRTADGRTITEKTPFEGKVPGGDTELTVTRSGYEPAVRRLTLDGPQRVTLWLDRAGQLLSSVVRFGTGSNPKQVAYAPDGTEMWSSLLGGNGVEVFDAETGKRKSEIRLGDHGAVEVIFNRDGSRAYASQMETASVYEIDTKARKVLRRIGVKGAWTKVLAFSPDERTLYASNWSSDNVSEIDVRSWRVKRVIPTVRTPRGLYPTPDGKRLYVAGYANGELARIDLATGRSKIVHTTGGSLRHLVGDGKTVYASDMERAQVFALDLATDKVREFADTNEKPNTIDLGADGKVLFVSCRGKNNPQSYYVPGPEWGSVLAFDTASGKPLDALVTGNQTTGLDVSADGTRLAVTDFLDNLVRVYEIPSYDKLAAGGGGRVVDHYAELPK